MLPFLPLTDMIIIGRPEGPSRYLYPATVGSSLLLAWGIEAVSLRLRPWGRYIHPGIAGAILLSSYFSLKQAEAPSLYSQGRHYIARGDYETGVKQLKRAIVQGPDSIDLYDAYVRLCMQTLGTNEVEAILAEALSTFPDGPYFHIYKLVVDSMKPDSTIQSQAQGKLDSFKKSGELEIKERRWLRFPSMREVEQMRLAIASAYKNMGNEFQDRGDFERAILAYRRAMEFSPRMKTYEALAAALVRAGFREKAAFDRPRGGGEQSLGFQWASYCRIQCPAGFRKVERGDCHVP